MKKEDKKKWLWAAGLGAVLLAAVVCLFVIPKSGPGAASSAVPSSAPAPTAAASPTPLALARAKNSDVVGWLSVPGTDIDDPVVQAADNEHYLRRTWEGKQDVWGSYFLDYECHASGCEALDRVSIIYGHSIGDDPDGKCFSQLKRYADPAFSAEHPYLNWQLADGGTLWQVFAAGEVSVTLNYLDPNPDDTACAQLLDALRETGGDGFEAVTVDGEDKLLILSTCTSDDAVRFVVAAKLL